MPTYAGYEILDMRPSHARVDATEPRSVVQGGLHEVPRLVVTSPGVFAGEMIYDFLTHADRAALLAFLTARQGSYEPFWTRSWKTDARGLGTTADTTLRVRDDGQLPGLSVGTRHVYIPHLDEWFKTTDWESEPGILTATIDGTITSGDMEDDDPIEFAYLVRLADDALEFRADARSHLLGVCRFRFMELQRETP
jgi:hypothetical protein